jgi:lipopolysaccharide assembly protein A
MRFLKTLLWVALLVGLTIFAINNWEPVSVKLWGGMLLDTKLPMLVIISFFAGFLPLWIWHRATHWRMKRRIMSLEGKTYRPPLDLGREDIGVTGYGSSAGSAGSGI